MNSSSCVAPGCGMPHHIAVCPTPFYYSSGPSAIPGISDHILSVATPTVAYWLLSGLFHILDTAEWKWLEKYRIHESQEVTKRNKVTRTEVVQMVVFQQVIQTMLAYWWTDGRPPLSLEAQCIEADRWRPTLLTTLAPLFGEKAAQTWARPGAYWMYWWAVPILQFALAMFLIDTWQYFLHRAMHMNKFLYRHLHSVHHRLYVPYSYGALYNHPVEGFLLDSVGAVLAEAGAQMSVRQATLLFGISVFKTVDDHCGYRFPWDPLQMFSQNGADYHDIHHQPIGIKSNFSQPFFIHWDVVLGTRLTRADIQARREKRQ